MAPSYQIIPPEAFKEIPWKNGQGTTCELQVCHGDTDEEFLWRISRAQVTSNGPFSNFLGYDRILILLAGNGMALSHGGRPPCQLHQVFDMVNFSRDWETRAVLMDEPIEDFNIMTKQGHCKAKVAVFKSFGENELAVDAHDFLVYAPHHEIDMNGSGNNPILLPQGHLFYLKGPVKLPW